MGKPAAGTPLTNNQKKRLVALAKRDRALWKEIVRKRRHSIAHALAEKPTFRAAARRAGII